MGRYCGKLRDFTAQELAAIASVEAMKRSGVEPAEIGNVLVDRVRQTQSPRRTRVATAAEQAATRRDRRPRPLPRRDRRAQSGNLNAHWRVLWSFSKGMGRHRGPKSPKMGELLPVALP